MKNRELLYPALLLKITDLNVSDQFKSMAALNGINTIQDLIDSNLDKLPQRKGAGMQVLKEAMALLRANGLAEFAED